MPPSEPLNVRVARALGYRAWKQKRGEYTLCVLQKPGAEFPWMASQNGEKLKHQYEEISLDLAETIGYFGTGVPPYGSDTPEGWAVTGPLIAKFDLNLQVNLGDLVCWDSEHGHEVGDQANPCAAIAEWVAKFGGPDAAR